MKTISQKIKVGIKWQAVTTVVSQAMMFAIGIALARILSPTEFGVFALSEIIFNFIFMFWNMGITSALVQKKEINQEHLNVAFTLSIILGVVCYLISLWGVIPLASYFNEPQIIPLGRIISLTFIIYSFDRVPTALLDRNLKFKERCLIGLINPITYGSICITLALSGFGPYSFAWGVVGRSIAITLAKVLLGFKLFTWRPKVSFAISEAKELLSFGISVTLVNICNFLLSNLQRIIPGKILGVTAVGYLSRSSNLSTLILRQANTTISSVLLPGFSKIQDDRKKIANWFTKFMFFTYSILTPPLVFFIFFPDSTILGLFGVQWQKAIPLLPWLAGTALLAAPSMYFETILKALGKPHYQLIISFLSLIILVLFLLIASKFGLIAIVIALFLSALCFLIINLTIFSFYNFTSLWTFTKTIIEPMAVSLLSAFCSSLIKNFLPPDISNFGQLACLLIPYLLVISLYVYYRYNNSLISYLNFDLKLLIKL